MAADGSRMETYQKHKIRQLFKAFSNIRKSQFWLPSDRSQNAKVQGGAFCRTSPAKLKIRTFQRPHLGASISFGSLYVRVWRCLQISNLRNHWVGSGWSIPSGLLFAQNTLLFQQIRKLPQPLEYARVLQVHQEAPPSSLHKAQVVHDGHSIAGGRAPQQTGDERPLNDEALGRST